jgi:NADPH-dependent ferric siderophore reductase
MSAKTRSRGIPGAVLRAGDYQLTVTGCRRLSQHYLRLSFDAGGLLTDRPIHPTMWIRMWFADDDTLREDYKPLANRSRRKPIGRPDRRPCYFVVCRLGSTIGTTNSSSIARSSASS